MRTSKEILKILFFAAVYFLSAKLGLSLAFIHANATAVWPPTGISLAVCILFGVRMWPGILLGAFLANVTTEGNIATSLGIAIGNALEAVVGAYLVKRFAQGAHFYRSTKTIFKYVFFAGVVSTLISATIGVSTLSAGGFANWNNFPSIWFTWWTGDMVSALMFAPFIVIWKTKPFPKLTPVKWTEAALLFVLLLFISQIVFGGWLFPISHENYPIEYLGIPLLLWAAFRFGQHGAITSVIFLSALATLGTLRGVGPFAVDEPNVSLLLLQTFMATITMMTLVLASALTEIKKDELTLKEINERLAESNKELEQFAYITSHDLQEPLRKIITFTDRINDSESSKFSEVDKDYFQRIKNATLKMKQLLEDLLNYSRITSEPKEKERADLTEIVKEVVNDFDVRMAELKAEIEIKQLPTLVVSRLQMKQLFQNLIGNALKFIKPGESPKIVIQAKIMKNSHEISVKDNGIGFDEKYLDRIFKPFQRLHPQLAYSGSGVGLAICQKIVHQHGGEITAKSQPGKGTTFYISLPLKPLL